VPRGSLWKPCVFAKYQELHIQNAFVSCSGFSLERGMTEVHLEEAQLKRNAIESVQQVYALVDSSKLGKEDLTPFARPEQICYLYTDTGITPEWKQAIEQAFTMQAGMKAMPACRKS
jgi:DeoR/GlpR family transcriptional regulator of sugar metabolism